MKRKTLKMAAVFSAAFILSAGMGTLVHAEETSEKVTTEKMSGQTAEEMTEKELEEMAENIAEETAKDTAEATTEEDSEAAETITGIVTASALRVRTEPSLDGTLIGKITRGNRVEILDSEGDWYQVDVGQDGPAYMFAEYIRIDDGTEASAEEEQEAEETGTGTVVAVYEGELDLLAAIIQCEAGGESETGKIAVGAVIMNRIRDSRFPNTITDVVYQSGQFSPVASGILSSVLSQGARSDCYDAAQKVLAGENPIGGALYFNSGSGRGQQIGNQHFY